MVGCCWVTENGLKRHKSLVGSENICAQKCLSRCVWTKNSHMIILAQERHMNQFDTRQAREVLRNPSLSPKWGWSFGGIQTFSHHKSYPWGWIRKHILDGMYGLVESKCFCRYCQWRCFVEILLMFGREQPASSCFGRAGTMPFQTFFLSRTICTVEFVKNKDRHISTQTYTSSQYICLTQRRREKQTRRREKWSPLAAPAFSPFFLSAADAAGAGQTYRVEHFELFYCQI